MFGYIRTDRPELLVKEDTLYKAVYCSLCKTLGRRYGISARLFLSYDATFITLFSSAVNNDGLELYKTRCSLNKCKKCNMCRGSEEFENYAADISVILTYYKILDNIRDSTFFKALLYRFILLFIIPLHNKAKRLAPDTEKAAKLFVKRQAEAESDPDVTPDKAADPTALFGEYVFSNIPGGEDQAEALCYFGRCIGRYIYLIDAFDDLPDDKKNGVFNPYINHPATTEEISGDLYLTASMAADALKEIRLSKHKDIIENIICRGITNRIDSIVTERKNGSLSDPENQPRRHR